MAMELGIDLGSSKTVIFSNNRVLAEEPTYVTIDEEIGKPVFFGKKAKATLGRTPVGLCTISPIKNGIISDIDYTEAMLKSFFGPIFSNRALRPRIMATLPAGLTQLQYHSLSNVIENAGGRSVFIIESPLAIACGLGLDFKKPGGTLIIDIGAGSTDVAVVSMGEIVNSNSFPIAGESIDKKIAKYIRNEYNVEIGALTAEQIKIKIGTAVKRNVEIAMPAKGRNVFSGLPEEFEISSTEVFEAIEDTVLQICNSVRSVLLNTDPDLVGDIIKNGFYITGGVAQLNGLCEFMSDYLGATAFMPDNPTYSVAIGAAAALKRPELVKNSNYRIRTIKQLTINNEAQL